MEARREERMASRIPSVPCAAMSGCWGGPRTGPLRRGFGGMWLQKQRRRGGDICGLLPAVGLGRLL